MNNKLNHLLRLATEVAIIVSIAGCASLKPDDFIPKSIAVAGNDHRIQGSVNIQIIVPDVVKSKFYDQALTGYSNVSFGKFYWNDDSMRYDILGNARSRVWMCDSRILRTALEKAITQKELFLQVEQGDADFVLDVWILDAFRSPKGATISDEMFITSIWRLTRVKDSRVTICSFARGHGKWNGSLEKALQDLIQNGMSILSDPSLSVTAMNVAGDWPSMGPVITEGYSRFKETWARLQKGMTEDDVRKLIPSLPKRSDCINRYFSNQPFEKWHELYLNKLDNNLYIETPSGWDIKVVTLNNHEVGITPHGFVSLSPDVIAVTPNLAISINSILSEIIEPIYSFYNVTFVNGTLEKWELIK